MAGDIKNTHMATCCACRDEAPADALARVDAALRGLGQAATVAAALGGGWFASAHGARAGLWVAAGFVSAAALLAAWRSDESAHR